MPMDIIIKRKEYEELLINGQFLKEEVSDFKSYEENYYLHFLRYLYYLCVMGAEGDYPESITMEEIKMMFATKKGKCKPKINKILIGEAPPPKYLNYFYNTGIPWKSGNPDGMVYCWTKAVKDALYPNTTFSSQTDFLIACAKKGFLLVDLLPYAISYKGKRKTNKYKSAVKLRMKRIIDFINSLNCCLHDEIAIAFGMKSFGEIILDNVATVAGINTWLRNNHKTLTPPFVIEDSRLCCCPLFQSKYLRVCGAAGYFHPVSCLLIQAGIN